MGFEKGSGWSDACTHNG